MFGNRKRVAELARTVKQLAEAQRRTAAARDTQLEGLRSRLAEFETFYSELGTLLDSDHLHSRLEARITRLEAAFGGLGINVREPGA